MIFQVYCLTAIELDIPVYNCYPEAADLDCQLLYLYNVLTFVKRLCKIVPNSLIMYFIPPLVPGPVNVTVAEVTPTYISVEWQEPAEKNGDIIGYMLKWRKCTSCRSNGTANSPWKSHVYNSSTVLNHSINDLAPFTCYEIEVFARTSAGLGTSESICQKTKTGCKILCFYLAA